MEALTQVFDERLQEIEAYLDLLDALDRQVQSGVPPTIGGSLITVKQQRILYSAVYLQLYNLVEATVSWCVDAICNAAAQGTWVTADLSPELRREWVRLTARTHLNLNEDNRLVHAVEALEHVLRGDRVSWPGESGRKGNWDDDEIDALSAQLGCELHLSPGVYKGVKRPIRDDKGPLRLIRDLRNRLAHGSISFEECGTGITVRDLRDTKNLTVDYLREVVAAYGAHVDEYKFLIPAKRPAAEAES